VSIVLYRIDERLIHGQVVIGWGSQLRPDRYAVVDDEVAAAPWEQELFVLGLPDDVKVDFLTVEEARSLLGELRASEERTILLTRDIATMAELARGGLLRDASVNLGGIHHAAGRTRIRPYLHLGPGERRELRSLAESGVKVTARDLPGSPRVDLQTLLEEGEEVP